MPFKRLQVHLFGHIHEQRGHWQKTPSGYVGGVIYRPNPSEAKVFQQNQPPPGDYPVQVRC